MKVTCTQGAVTGFQPIAVTILLETPQDAYAFRTLVSRDKTIPNLVEEKFRGQGDPSEAAAATKALLVNMQQQLTALGFVR